MKDFSVDREHVKRIFAEYTQKYNANNEKIRLKIVHTIKVAELCERIAKSISLSNEEIDLAWLIGMLHDIGRFEQEKRYGTFEDAKSVKHAELGAEILFDQGLISDFLDIDSNSIEYQIIYKAVLHHSDYKLPDDLEDPILMFCNIIRDADKLDIFRVVFESKTEVIYGVSVNELMNEDIADEVMDCFNEQHSVLRALRKQPVDNMVVYVSFAYELVYNESRRLCNEQGYIWKILSFHSNRDDVNKKINNIRTKLVEFLNN